MLLLLIISITINIVQWAMCIIHKEEAKRSNDLLSVTREILCNLWEKYKNVCWKKNCWSKYYKKQD